MLKRIRFLQEWLGDLGPWRIEHRGKHLKLCHVGTGAVVFASCTPSDHRSDLNLKSQARRLVRQRREHGHRT